MARKRSSGSSPKKRNESSNGGFVRRWLKRLILVAVGVMVLGALALGTAVYFAERSLPSYSAMMNSEQGQMIVVKARDGTEIVSLGPSYGEWLYSNEIPQVMKDAMVSVEDRRFYSHFGIDPLGLLRAVFVSFRNDERVAATSTITQQLARNIFLSNSRTIDRKAREAVLAMALEMRFSKEQILELYLNKVYFGGGAYGIDSASRKFFSHSAKNLSTAEAAIIAGLVKAPSHYSPTADVNAAVARANVVLAQMRKYGAIGPGEAASVDVSAVKLRPDQGTNSIRYFTDWALPQLDMLLPDTREPIVVWTTLDIADQRAATEAVKSNVPSGAQGALVSMDRDGAILAMVGGTDYVTTNYNRATDALRQPGSAWKLFVYLAALESGYTPDDRVVDGPVTIGNWSPHNAGGGYAGEIDVRSAFAYSKNTVAAQLGNEVGFGNVASMARRFGITTKVSTNPSMVLGTSEVRVIDMTRAFAAVSDGGKSVEPYGITRVTTADGKVLYQHQPARRYDLVADYVAAGITDLLQTAVATGTGRAAQIGRPVAGKTGTTSSNKDGWFVGFSSGITTGVWMGRDDAKAVPGLSGGRAPARAFAAYMRKAVADRPVEQFDTELKLPEWQLEPDDEYYYGDPDEYYFIDEQGNLIEPQAPDDPGDVPFPPEPQDGATSRPQGSGAGAPPPPAAGQAAPPAASDDFLERAIGGAVDDNRQQQNAPAVPRQEQRPRRREGILVPPSN
ncbi:transglycosylase domain-containing protein [Altericroceibacterium endophyticum]|uniref:PBP1A family penicillin-binding protein n=1 Tax=Altericroceibacterium endophyticum TaxID=1808508 RepID=A0A6I4T497_9SPHN|nr:PBP1A family penicillin-binding protein [Altericroceibacterium endophyticum]MXO65169.1 PBP1A family penicillin-binding protein [Altericroceibacterium endophyticum]